MWLKSLRWLATLACRMASNLRAFSLFFESFCVAEKFR